MSWNGVKKQSNIENIKAWCDEMKIRNYTINSQGEIDVDGDVNLHKKNFKELPYKFGEVSGNFNVDNCKNLKTLKNCPNKVGGFFSCYCCTKLDSLKDCPKRIGGDFYCYNCKQKFTGKEVKSLCKVYVYNNIYIN